MNVGCYVLFVFIRVKSYIEIIIYQRVDSNVTVPIKIYLFHPVLLTFFVTHCNYIVAVGRGPRGRFTSHVSVIR